MRRILLTTKDGLEFHFDGISRTIPNGSFRADGKDDVVLQLRGTLLNSTNNILSNVAGQPFVNRRDLRTKTLKLVDRHWTNFKQGSSQEVLDTLLCGHQFLPKSSVACGVLQRSFGQKLKQWSARPNDASPDRGHNFIGLLHRWCGGDLVCCCRIDVEEEVLNQRRVHRL